MSKRPRVRKAKSAGIHWSEAKPQFMTALARLSEEIKNGRLPEAKIGPLPRNVISAYRHQFYRWREEIFRDAKTGPEGEKIVFNAATGVSTTKPISSMERVSRQLATNNIHLSMEELVTIMAFVRPPHEEMTCLVLSLPPVLEGAMSRPQLVVVERTETEDERQLRLVQEHLKRKLLEGDQT